MAGHQRPRHGVLDFAWLCAVKPFSVTGGTTVIEKASTKPGGALRPLSYAGRIVRLCLALSDSKHSLSRGHAWKARYILLRLCHSSITMCSKFEMMPQKAHNLPQGPSHLATPFIGAHRSSAPWPTTPSLSVVLPSLLAERGLFPVAGSPFLWPGLGSFFGCCFERPSVASRGVVWRRCSNRPRVRPPAAADLVIKLLGAVYTAISTLPCQLTKPGGSRKRLKRFHRSVASYISGYFDYFELEN